MIFRRRPLPPVVTPTPPAKAVAPVDPYDLRAVIGVVEVFRAEMEAKLTEVERQVRALKEDDLAKLEQGIRTLDGRTDGAD